MSSGALFPSLVSGSRSSSSKYLVEFRAGKMTLKGSTVTPDKRKGSVYIQQTDDSLIHFCWKDRTSGNVEDVSEDDESQTCFDCLCKANTFTFHHLDVCRIWSYSQMTASSREWTSVPQDVFMCLSLKLDLKGSSFGCRWAKHFTLLSLGHFRVTLCIAISQICCLKEPKTDKDEEYCRKVNEYLNNPPMPGALGSGGGGSHELSGELLKMAMQCWHKKISQYSSHFIISAKEKVDSKAFWVIWATINSCSWLDRQDWVGLVSDS